MVGCSDFRSARKRQQVLRFSISIYSCRDNAGNSSGAELEDGSKAIIAADPAAHVTLNLSGCFYVCGQLQFQGGQISASAGGIGIIKAGASVGWANQSVCNRNSGQVWAGGGEGIGGTGTMGINNNGPDPSDSEFDFGFWGGAPVAGGTMGTVTHWDPFGSPLC
jgi:hypothetical protein